MVLLLAGCSGDSEEFPGLEDAAVDHVEATFAGQSGRLYDSLHPAQQELVSRDEWAQCVAALESPVVPDGFDVSVVGMETETLTVPGTDLDVEMVAVSIRLSVGGQSQTQTRRFVEVDGAWRWMLLDPSEPC